MQIKLRDSFNRELPADKNKSNTRRQVLKACYSFVTPRVPSDPKLIHASIEMAATLGIPESELNEKTFLDIASGSKIIEGSSPYAMCYGGHQFGHWAGQLGDGRAINLGELVHDEKRWALQLKGSGETPYSRTADGLAVLRSSIREHLCSEAMFHLGVPTTRSLSLCLTGDNVLRDMMYDGNAAYEKGAVVCRVSPSFIRFGNFQIFASRQDTENLKLLTDYTIKYFFPSISDDDTQKYLHFFEAVSDRTLQMIVDWQRVGFVHGVMNTDNMSILGLTIDYGPYGWLEDYDPNWTPNTTDRTHQRYRYGHQPAVAHWNLFQLANAVSPLFEDIKPLEEKLKQFQTKYITAQLNMMRSKLGLATKNEMDQQLILQLEKILVLTETDMTIFYRLLGAINSEMTATTILESLNAAFYKPEELESQVAAQWIDWINNYKDRLQKETLSDTERQEKMNAVNPKYVLRNYMAQLAIDDANKGDYKLIDDLHQLLKKPYAEQPENEKWFAKRPEWARHKVGCSMLSCSS